jgi:outer membrane protein TolC
MSGEDEVKERREIERAAKIVVANDREFDGGTTQIAALTVAKWALARIEKDRADVEAHRRDFRRRLRDVRHEPRDKDHQ